MVPKWFLYLIWVLIWSTCVLAVAREIPALIQAVANWLHELLHHPRKAIEIVWRGFWESWTAVLSVATTLIAFIFDPPLLGYRATKILAVVAMSLIFLRACIDEKFHGKKEHRKDLGTRIWVIAILFAIFGGVSFLVCGALENARRGSAATLHNIWNASLWWRTTTVQSSSCHINAAKTSELISRMYGRGTISPAGATSSELSVQELFYEWTVTITVNQDVHDMAVNIHQESADDGASLRVIPQNASISAPKPAWMSGFEEKNRHPDYYARRVLFPTLTAESTATLTFRWPLKFRKSKNTFVPSDFRDYDFEVIPESQCGVTQQPYDSEQQFTLLVSQLKAFSKFSGRSDHKPLRIKMDPDEPLPPLGPNQVETTIEAKCQDAACDRFTMHQMEARINRNPTVSRR